MKYLIIKEEICSTCEGNFSKIVETITESRSQKSYPTVVYCLDCKEGVVRTEVSLKDAIVDLLGKDSAFMMAIGQAERFPILK